MKYLLDTCIISELIKKYPNRKVLKWISSLDIEDIRISVLTFGEIFKGIQKQKDESKRRLLINWFSNEVIERYKYNTIDISYEIALKWGEIDAMSENSGNKIPVIDGLLSASAITENLIFVTRNEKDIKKSGCEIFNPWNL